MCHLLAFGAPCAAASSISDDLESQLIILAAIKHGHLLRYDLLFTLKCPLVQAIPSYFCTAQTLEVTACSLQHQVTVIHFIATISNVYLCSVALLLFCTEYRIGFNLDIGNPYAKHAEDEVGPGGFCSVLFHSVAVIMIAVLISLGFLVLGQSVYISQ